MASAIRDKLQRFQQRLTRLDNQPLGKAALVVILFLDLFILTSIFDGLGAHTAQMTAPHEHIPPLCRDVVLDSEWNATTRLTHLARAVSRYHASLFLPDERAERKPLHVTCAPIVRAFRAVRVDEGLARSLREILKLRQETDSLRRELERVKGAYDTALLESMAKPRRIEAGVASLQQEIGEKTRALDELVRKQRLLEEAVEKDSRVRELFALVAGVSEADRKTLRDDFRQLNFWYPVKRLGMEMLFLLPLFIVFYAWNGRSIARNRPFQTLVSSHLLVVVLIPVFFKLIELVYDIIPRKLLRQVIELLETLNLVAIWHYLVIGGAILGALALIYLFQRKLFSREKLMQRRIAKGQCQHCGVHLPAGSRHCTACGADQYRVCVHCQELTHVQGRYCKACGRSAQ